MAPYSPKRGRRNLSIVLEGPEEDHSNFLRVEDGEKSIPVDDKSLNIIPVDDKSLNIMSASVTSLAIEDALATPAAITTAPPESKELVPDEEDDAAKDGVSDDSTAISTPGRMRRLKKTGGSSLRSLGIGSLQNMPSLSSIHEHDGSVFSDDTSSFSADSSVSSIYFQTSESGVPFQIARAGSGGSSSFALSSMPSPSTAGKTLDLLEAPTINLIMHAPDQHKWEHAYKDCLPPAMFERQDSINSMSMSPAVSAMQHQTVRLDTAPKMYARQESPAMIKATTGPSLDRFLKESMDSIPVQAIRQESVASSALTPPRNVLMVPGLLNIVAQNDLTPQAAARKGSNHRAFFTSVAGGYLSDSCSTLQSSASHDNMSYTNSITSTVEAPSS